MPDPVKEEAKRKKKKEAVGPTRCNVEALLSESTGNHTLKYKGTRRVNNSTKATLSPN